MRRSCVYAGLVVALACEATPSPAPPSEAPPSATATPPTWAGLEVEHWLPGPHRRGQPSDDRSALEAGCRNCHAEIAREWAASQHAGAWSSAAFQNAFAVEPLGFCQACHAPEVSPRAEVPRWAADIGVGCVTCHVEPGTTQVWARDGHGDGEVPHELLRSPAFAGPQACANCHEFEFPDAAVRERPLLMQSTIREHAASSFAERSCADCHMPIVDGRRSHAFIGAYDRDMLARSLKVAAARSGDRLTIDLRPGEVGHAVPTGDLLRRLELRVELIGEDGQTTGVLARRWFGRRFGPVPQHSGVTVRGELEDSRVGPSGAVLTIELPERARGQAIRWTLIHQRVAHAVRDPTRAVVEGELEFAGGVVEP